MNDIILMLNAYIPKNVKLSDQARVANISHTASLMEKLFSQTRNIERPIQRRPTPWARREKKKTLYM